MDFPFLHAFIFRTPVGEFSAAVDRGGALVATAFGDLARLRMRLPARAAALSTAVPCDALVAALGTVREQVLAYFAGERTAFDLPLAPVGTAWQQRVWAALGVIPFGETRTYGQLAAQLGAPAASRAVGRANATNPICLIVPCHRVIGADGSLTGFAFGEEIKRRLLAHERALVTATRAA